jgi:hypothetical protein
LWLDVFKAERGWGDFDDNDYVKDDQDEPRQGQGKELGGWLISNMTTRMTTRTRSGLGPGKCDGSVGEDECGGAAAAVATGVAAAAVAERCSVRRGSGSGSGGY